MIYTKLTLSLGDIALPFMACNTQQTTVVNVSKTLSTNDKKIESGSQK
jgi:hypothetical protein